MALPSKGRMAEDTLELLKVRTWQPTHANGSRRGDVLVDADAFVDVRVGRYGSKTNASNRTKALRMVGMGGRIQS